MRFKPSRNLLKTRSLIFILIVIYIAAIICGILIISYAQCGIHRTRMIQMIEEKAQTYSEGQELKASKSYGYVLDADGRMLERYGNDTLGVLYDDPVEVVSLFLDEVIDGDSLMKLVWFVPNNTTLGYTSFYVVAAPVYENGQVTAAVMEAWEVPDLLEIILGYIIIITIVMAVVTIVLLYNHKCLNYYKIVQRNYIDNLTHELKSPIASIIALTENLSDRQNLDANDRNVYYGMIIKEGKHQLQMIQSALDLSKLEAGRIDLTKSACDPKEIFAGIREKYELSCDLLDIGFTIDESIDKLPELFTNGESIGKVLGILVENSLKFVDEGGKIRISAQTGKSSTTICVEDNGCGISDADIDHIFEKFYKADKTNNKTGSGLGLSIAWEILHSLNEKIWVRSREGEGTKVFFTISLK